MDNNKIGVTPEEKEASLQKLDNELPNFCLPRSKTGMAAHAQALREEASKKSNENSPSNLYLSYFK